MPNLSMTATGKDLMPTPQVWVQSKPMPLRTAQQYANKIAEWIAPYCLQLETVGEIRRQCWTCKEVEFLVIPKAAEGRNLLIEFLDAYAKDSNGRALWEEPPRFQGKTHVPVFNARLFLPKCTLRIHFAAPENWFLRLFESTGSQAHFLEMEHLLREKDGHWRYARFIAIHNSKIVPRCEGEIYDLVKLPFRPAFKRQE